MVGPYVKRFDNFANYIAKAVARLRVNSVLIFHSDKEADLNVVFKTMPINRYIYVRDVVIKLRNF